MHFKVVFILNNKDELLYNICCGSYIEFVSKLFGKIMDSINTKENIDIVQIVIDLVEYDLEYINRLDEFRRILRKGKIEV